MDKLDYIKKFIDEINFQYVDIPTESIDNIYELIINDKITIPNNNVEMFYYGIYYYEKEDYDSMIKYYLMAIENGGSIAANELGCHYYQKKDYENAVKYLTLGADRGCSQSANSLGYYYYKQKDYDNMIKNYLIAINRGNCFAANNFGYYYSKKADYDNAIKYYLLAINLGSNNAAYNLGYCYYKQKDYDNAVKYYLIAIAINGSYLKGINKLKEIIKQNILEKYHYIKIIEELDHKTYLKVVGDNKIAILLYEIYKQKIDLIELPFKYGLDGDGFIEAKNDFIAQLIRS